MLEPPTIGPLTFDEAMQWVGENEITEEDIRVAWKASNAIQNLDHKLFPDKSIPAALNRQKSAHDNNACYVKPQEGAEEQYVIYVPGFAQALEAATSYKLLFVLEEDGSVNARSLEDSSEPVVTVDELILGIAGHEVRHHIQHHWPNLVMFSPEHIQSINDDPLLKEILKFNIILREADAEVCRERGESEEYIAERSGQMEYDAGVIENLILAKLDECLTIEDWANIVKSQLLTNDVSVL